MSLDLTKLHGIHTDQKRITTYDQDGVLYDSITLMPLLEPYDTVKYVVPDEAPFTKKRTEHERWTDAINTMIAAGTLSGEDASKLRGMVATAEKVEAGQ